MITRCLSPALPLMLAAVVPLADASGDPPRPATSQPAPTQRLSSDPDAEAALLRALSRGFRRMHLDRFTIYTDAPEAIASDLGRAAEQTASDVCGFARRLALPDSLKGTRLPLILFDTWNGYSDACRRAGLAVDESVPGIFDRRTGHCMLFNFANARLMRDPRAEVARARVRLERGEAGIDAVALRRQIKQVEAQLAHYERLINQTVVRHEIAHQVLTALNVPAGNAARDWRWLSEGLAMQFEEAGGYSRHRAADLMPMLAADERGALVDRTRDLRRLVSDPAMIGPGAADASGAYALAWGLVFHLVEKHPHKLAAFLRDPAPPAGAPLPAFENAFGPLDAAFHSTWRTHMLTLDPSHSPMPPSARP